eukprot:CAMPEP_0119390868 /NCGR_PEP_ID=MMETSP1334-20130426/115028_1 /TAXON_ID=127549 /ORGANISM="Calcidiscus leptoporus, Strain RCC1130" /LENGTH=48 /DNA_ID= /DNA_START= /DNA_END= /DNA_ORIENTATION=
MRRPRARTTYERWLQNGLESSQNTLVAEKYTLAMGVRTLLGRSHAAAS